MEMPVVQVWHLAVVSGLLQALGYCVYIRKSKSGELDPNPTTWLMFAYGTALLTILELDSQAGWELLVLPLTCATFSIYVAAECWKRGTLHWPADREDQIAFLADVALTIAYCVAWVMVFAELISESQRGYAVLTFLICSNAATITAFIPIVRSTAARPSSERSLPWFIWTMAYLSLLILTLWEEGWKSALVIYPMSNLLLHGCIAWLARQRRREQLANVHG